MDKEQTTAIVGRLERASERERARADAPENDGERERVARRFSERDGGLFPNMLFVSEAAQGEEEASWAKCRRNRILRAEPRAAWGR